MLEPLRQSSIIVKKVTAKGGIDPYHTAAMLDLKQGWTGINNELKINYAS